jgi:hypothetical protein
VDRKASDKHVAGDQQQSCESQNRFSHCWMIQRRFAVKSCGAKSIGLFPSGKDNRVSTALGPAPSYEGDDRMDQERNSGSDRENCNPHPDLLCLPAESMGFKGDFPQLGAPEGNGFPLTDHHAARL